MLKKTILIYLLFCGIQLFTACFDCKCPPHETREIRYNDFYIYPYSTIGFENKEILEGDIAYKNAFALKFVWDCDEYKVSCNEIYYKSSIVQSVYACDCEPPYYTYYDKVIKMEIIAVDIQSNVSLNVTENFGFQKDDGTIINLTETYIFELYERYKGEYITPSGIWQIIDINDIPDEVIFKVNFYFESGNHISKNSSKITFM